MKDRLEKHIKAREEKHEEQMAKIRDDKKRERQEAAFQERIEQIKLVHNKMANVTLGQARVANERKKILFELTEGRRTMGKGQPTTLPVLGGKTNKKSKKANKKSKKANKKSKKANKK